MAIFISYPAIAMEKENGKRGSHEAMHHQSNRDGSAPHVFGDRGIDCSHLSMSSKRKMSDASTEEKREYRKHWKKMKLRHLKRQEGTFMDEADLVPARYSEIDDYFEGIM